MRKFVMTMILLISAISLSAEDGYKVSIEEMLKFSFGHELYEELTSAGIKPFVEGDEHTIYFIDDHKRSPVNHKVLGRNVSSYIVRNETKNVYSVTCVAGAKTKHDLIAFANQVITMLETFLKCDDVKVKTRDADDGKWEISFTTPEQHKILFSIEEDHSQKGLSYILYNLSVTDETLCGKEVKQTSDVDAEAIFFGNENAILPVSPVKKTGDVFADAKHSLAIITAGGTMAGSGFIAREKGKLYLYTNEHVARGGLPFVAKLLNGEELELSLPEVAANADLIRFELKNSAPYLEIEPLTPNTGDKITVLGNSGGGFVSTSIKGEVLGVGPGLIEISANFVPGNSGSPVLNEQGHVVGIATFIVKAEYEKNHAWAFKGTRFSDARRFAVRLINIKWTSMTWREYLLFVSLSKKGECDE